MAYPGHSFAQGTPQLVDPYLYAAAQGMQVSAEAYMEDQGGEYNGEANNYASEAFAYPQQLAFQPAFQQATAPVVIYQYVAAGTGGSHAVPAVSAAQQSSSYDPIKEAQLMHPSLLSKLAYSAPIWVRHESNAAVAAPAADLARKTPAG
jgi:hypothetical protein